MERVEANMFLFFISLMIQALIEREIRNKMKDNHIKSLQVYPENRDSTHPTTSKIFEIFRDVSTYSIGKGKNITEEYFDLLNDTQKSILGFLGISESQY